MANNGKRPISLAPPAKSSASAPPSRVSVLRATAADAIKAGAAGAADKGVQLLTDKVMSQVNGDSSAAAIGQAVGGAFTDHAGMARYILANPFEALEQLSAAGVPISTVLHDYVVTGDAAAVRRWVSYLAGLESGMFIVSDSVNGAVQASEKLKGLSGNTDNLMTLRSILSWAHGHYGSRASAIRAHSMQQAFFELSTKDVTHGFELFEGNL